LEKDLNFIRLLIISPAHTNIIWKSILFVLHKLVRNSPACQDRSFDTFL